MGPRSRSITPRRSYSKSPGRRNGRKKSHSRHSRDKVYDSHSRSRSVSRQPPSPPPLPPSGRNGRRNAYSGESKSSSRSLSPPRHHRRRTHSRSPPPHDKRRATREKPLQNRCIGVFGLNVLTTQLKIREIFSKFGPIERIQVVVDAQTGRSRGFCFIYYEDMADAKTAKDACSGIQIDDRRIRVDYSTTQRPHTPTPGVYMGRSTRIHRERGGGDDHQDRYRDEHRAPRRRSPSPYSRSSHRSERRRRYERSRSRSYTPRRQRY